MATDLYSKKLESKLYLTIFVLFALSTTLLLYNSALDVNLLSDVIGLEIAALSSKNTAAKIQASHAQTLPVPVPGTSGAKNKKP